MEKEDAKNMNNMNYGDLFIEIADISSEEKYIKFPVYQSINFNRDDKDTIVPLTAYYYTALKLCIISGTHYSFDRAIDNINMLWFACNKNNFYEINERIREISNQIRMIVRSSEKSGIGVFLNTSSDFESIALNNVMKYYDEWLETKSNRKIANKFENHKGECVAIALPNNQKLMDKSNCYLSISGSKKDYTGSIPGIRMENYIKKTYSAINDLLQYVFGFKFSECHLTDDTKRYTYYSTKSEIEGGRFNGKVLKHPVNFYTDYHRFISKVDDRLSRHYSCCEKKIINYMDFVNIDYVKLTSHQVVVNKLTAYEFRIGKEPCLMCRPALIGCYSIKYEYSSFQSFIHFKTITEHFVKLSPFGIKKEPLMIV